jgi:imidazolonepropionase-like amidohydrolase
VCAPPGRTVEAGPTRAVRHEDVPPRGRFHLRGHVLPEGGIRDVWVVDGRVTFEQVDGAETLVDGGWLLPGLVDAHAHLALASPGGADAPAEERVAASARAQLSAGVLLVREPGGPDRTSTGVGPDSGLPRTQTAGRFLAAPGGYFPGLAREVSPQELSAAVTEEAAAGTGWVKLVGDFPDDSGRMTPLWDEATIASAVAAAHAGGARLTIHAVSPGAVVTAVRAGVDGIEHGTGMPRDLLPELVEHGVAWTPTLLISDPVRDWAIQDMADAHRDEVLGWVDGLPATVAAAARAGVTLLAGTDAGLVPHGMIAAEVTLLVAAGVPPDTAVAAASWGARQYLRMPGIEEGAPADLLALADDPRRDRSALGRHLAVVLDGRAMR